ncbi:MAG: MFS transporter [Anaerolineae bacterium]|nr:MFS transporter [Anaerolineae bacterium]
MIQKARNTYLEYPRTFWVLMGGNLVDNLGGAMLFPFFSLYVTKHFNVGLTEAGIVFSIFAVTSIFGSIIGGALADKFGRKVLVLGGLVFSATSSIAMALVNDLNVFYMLAAVVGFLGNFAGPAHQAMIADILPERQHADGYGIQRVVHNLAVTIGPAVGGFLASTSFLLLFITDAVTSLITAAILYKHLPETKPESTEEEKEQSLAQSFAGYGKVIRDWVFTAFIVSSILMWVVYMQMNSTLPVFMNELHGFDPIYFGWLMTINAGMVVLFQFWITRRIADRPPLIMMAFGTIFYMIGFGMYGFVFGFPMFILAMVILTIGEMIVTPVAQALVARLAPEHMRGRYMAVSQFSWSIPFAIGPLLAGRVYDLYDPNWVWYGSIIISFMAIIAYLGLHTRAAERVKAAEVPLEPHPSPAD